MKVRTLALAVAFAVAAYFPVFAQQAAQSQQNPVNPPAATATQDSAKSCGACCKGGQSADKPDCCAAKDGQAMECCQSKDGKEAACCHKDSMAAMDCCKAHYAKTHAAKNAKGTCANCNAKDAKSCCGKNAMACNMKDKKGCCSGEGMGKECPAHTSGR
jgi:hypothetical protein